MAKQDNLLMKHNSAWNSFKNKEEIFKFTESYKKFLSESKTERACIQNILTTLKKQNFKEFHLIKNLKKGDKFYKLIKEKVIIAGIVGEELDSLNIIGSHTDSPRLDLKPNPVYEDSELALLQTHYYGGIKKYHWVNLPLSLQGIVYTKKEKIILSIGEKEDEPKFIISDLLPHLARDQMEKVGRKVVEAEQLRILFGNIPINEKATKNQIKLNVLKILKEQYQVSEEDFRFAEFSFVPSLKPTDIGLDRSLIGAYGQDDKVCVFTSLMALLKTKQTKNTAITFFVDKEEIGSAGDVGADSFILQNFAQEYIEKTNLKIGTGKLFENSRSISADVTAAMDPIYKEVHDKDNASHLGRGVSIEKYGGSGGKYSSNDASAEYMNFIRKILVQNKIPHQIGELGKIDIGGGGTIAMFMSKYGMDCVDVGPCVMGMHSPCEVTSKVDIYCAYLLYKAFFEN